MVGVMTSIFNYPYQLEASAYPIGMVIIFGSAFVVIVAVFAWTNYSESKAFAPIGGDGDCPVRGRLLFGRPNLVGPRHVEDGLEAQQHQHQQGVSSMWGYMMTNTKKNMNNLKLGRPTPTTPTAGGEAAVSNIASITPPIGSVLSPPWTRMNHLGVSSSTTTTTTTRATTTRAHDSDIHHALMSSVTLGDFMRSCHSSSGGAVVSGRIGS